MQNYENIEIWKPIKGFEGFYEVSSFGRIKSLESGRWKNREKILKPAKHKFGYLYVILCKDGIRKNFRVHRLVAENFILNPLNLPQVNHKDEVKTNNCVENLEWCDAKYNINYGTHNEKMSKSKSKSVYQYTKSGEFVRGWESTMDIERDLGYFQSNISRCCHGKLKSAYKFVWSYKPPF